MPDQVEKITAPWDADKVETLNRFQESGVMHPFTCPHHSQGAPLRATTGGFVCPASGCLYWQRWAHDFMADADWLNEQIRQRDRLFRRNRG